MESNYICGIHPVTDAVIGGKKIEKVLFKQGMDSPHFRNLMELLQEKNISIQFAPIERLNSVTRSNHQGVIAFLSQVDYVSLEEMVAKATEARKNPVIILLDGVSDVRNFGGIARTAECASADGIIMPAKGSAAINAESIKTSAGALMRIPVAKVTNLREAIFYLSQSGFQIIAATEKAEKNIYDADFSKATAIILGSEDKGISKSSLSLANELVKIPITGATGSLNVSVAASVVLFEIVRQRIV
ncbi:MAG: 23S rRNA (guanosine(2251)-2'-O)-methyltransferase RlmB [Bacteroidetes bacterium GWE2_39_28]|nr:MAG: 23S rRNA (guanosine(2251)-2'-O)-methyltransferase RlmB [Bacteroidetes bacterium GWE2_39_28]OFY14079.1 MAG: 23S rRNA (guanosine(2251)-2'-O)-methyltransferase RlmB [Bacteroidetes bacterium GWF2_39_10]OFZ10781.1 MAG: 23S rRNA (guanosine(2251)-2'-O)-methyltransferase RlmB [Bacteroidetes bacterium RIFOXYC2_FULL_39_11]HCT94019.1 23S rRNA (guanosine(2251)-2'-O)-methyltransferase RlmB [Rikenellaceae bacterium]HCV15069.1 23S rRNA (guanosine(2251)-2'-O)-methyltransferase RlmB [Rikenellaceae bacte